MMKNSTRIAALVILVSGGLAGCTHTKRAAQQPAGEPMQISPLAISAGTGGFKPRAYAALTQRSWVLGHLAQRNEARGIGQKDGAASAVTSASLDAKSTSASPVTSSFRTVVAPAMDPAQFNPNRIR